ncbi:hypothetical protein JAMAL_55 [Mycobacterium phage JAMaL]|uniref:Uncharacterized protein n=1 Tax=Mycobacterium phage JAMaL TaxID=1429905 RepID=V5UPS6_9CAUD|nr:hypothetical protein CH22_gp55 [Mycobacterium phage JAMaL]AHB79375.1 hypothetical protein JAMAL_55 [Mycobacterium phage JAMaL]
MTSAPWAEDAYIRDEPHLRTLPDGSIISWLRIAGDRTSEAVAFVRREVTTESGLPQVDVWISPGGWDPMSIAQAGVTFPCQVVRVGEYHHDQYLGAELPMLSETLSSCTHGGTWAREKALECASRAWAGMSAIRDRDGAIIDTARAFEAYLDPEPDAVDPDDEPELDQAPSLGELADVLRGWSNLGVTREALNYAIERVAW